jgi:predicted transcriptional regulator
MTINGEVYIPDVLDSVSELSRRLKIPKSSIGRAIQSIADDGGYIERVGSHGRGVKYKIVLEPDKAKEFIDHYHSTLATKKIKKKARTWSKRSDWDINKFSKVG